MPAVDASDVVEKGRSGETYRLHYAIDLHTMTSDTFKITKEETGETLSNFDFRRGDLVVADRAYGTLKGMNHCLTCGADYILRYIRAVSRFMMKTEIRLILPGGSRG
ncbi:MAG: hypothetical protein LBB98_00860 [Treponema sp.]|nr:hypothetical protein [Treponema sp.]